MPYVAVAPLPPVVSLNGAPVQLVFRNIKAQSSYTGGQWDMWKGIWRKPGPSSVGLEQDFTATNPGPPTQATPTNIVLPCDSNGDFILAPAGTVTDIVADTGNNNYSGVRFPNFTP